MPFNQKPQKFNANINTVEISTPTFGAFSMGASKVQKGKVFSPPNLIALSPQPISTVLMFAVYKKYEGG